jgi:hypothetical protein
MPMNDANSMPPNTGVPTPRRASWEAPSATTSGKRPKMKGKRRHHDRTEAQPRPFDRGLEQGNALLTPLLGKLDDQNAVLGRETDQHHHADLGIKIEGEAAEHDCHARPQHGDGDREQHGHRNRPALVEGDQEEVGEQHRKPEDDCGLALRPLLLKGGVGPLAPVIKRSEASTKWPGFAVRALPVRAMAPLERKAVLNGLLFENMRVSTDAFWMQKTSTRSRPTTLGP